MEGVHDIIGTDDSKFYLLFWVFVINVFCVEKTEVKEAIKIFGTGDPEAVKRFLQVDTNSKLTNT